MKKKILIIVSIILLLLIIGASIFSIYLNYAMHNTKTYNSCLIVDKETQTLISKNEKIKILQLTDLQFFDYVQASTAFNSAKQLIEKTEPDLIVLTGDTFANNLDVALINKFIEFMDSFKLPWAIVFGNHDYDRSLSPTEMSNLFNNTKYGLFKAENIGESYSNYSYKVKYNNKLIYSLIFMDSKKEGFLPEHVVWYENQINAHALENNGDVLDSLLFFHIPLPELEEAYDLYVNDSSIGSGEKNESFCVQETEVGMFNKIVELNSTKALIYGHDHINNLIINYKGVKWCYGLKSAKTSYYFNHMIGGNLYTIGEDYLEIDRIYI